MDANDLLKLRDVRVWYPIRRGIFSRVAGYVRAVDGITLDIKEGETLGLVGESGCGKTTLGRSLLGLEKVYSGEIIYGGHQLGKMPADFQRQWRRDNQMVFQDPQSSLNPRMSVLELLTEGPLHYGLPEGETPEELAMKLMAEVGLDPAARFRYPHEFSGGQRQRISIARALSLNPRFVVCDEPVSALDVSVQAQILNLLLELREKRKLTYLFISHDLGVVNLVAQRVAVMYAGRVVELGETREILESPRHPYTQALVAALPVPGRKMENKIVFNGMAPGVGVSNWQKGCAFCSRCPRATEKCGQKIPVLQDDKEGKKRKIACFNL